MDDEYYNDQEDSSDAVYASLRRERNLGFIAACVGAVLAVLGVGAVFAMMPLKQDVPWIIRENTCTGEVSVPERVTAENYQSTRPTDFKYAYEYFKAREGFNERTLREDIKTVYLLSSDAHAKDYKHFMDNSPDSPMQLLKSGDKRELHVNSIIPLSNDQLQLRFTTTDTISGMKQPAEPWISVLTFGYSASNVPKDQQNRFENPVGYMVTDYQRELEIIQVGK